MADFCNQCLLEDHILTGDEFADLPPDMRDLYGCDGQGVLCEGCGYTHVDSEGKCLDHVHGGE